MNRREFFTRAGALAVAASGVDSLHELMKAGTPGNTAGTVLAAPIPMKRMNAFAKEMLDQKKYLIGFPGNQNLDMKDFYQWYVETGLCNVSLNNVGNPHVESASMNTHVFENEVIEYFAPFYGFRPEETWGIVTHSGTDGNMHGMYFGVKYLLAKTRQLPVVYVSDQAHYSVKKLADMQNLEMRIIPTLPMGQMDTAAFERELDSGKPALVVIAVGTTFKGAIDDHPAIARILERKKPPAVYTMLYAALFGGYLPFTPFREIVDRIKLHFDCIAVSGHKFFGFDEPCGLFITSKEVFDSQNPFRVPYLNDAVPTITCSRSALGALKFWWQMTRNGEQEYRRQASYILENAKYQKALLDDMNYPAWLNPMSNTVFFKRPSEWIMKKWSLAPDHDERLGGNLAHEVLMQHESRQTVDEFVADLKKDLSHKA